MNDQEPGRLLQALLCGDLEENDPRVRATLTADPRLRADLAALRAAERQWAALGADAAEIRALATASITATDRARVRAALAPPRRATLIARAAWLVGMAAAALLAIWLFGPRPQRAGNDGSLGGARPVQIERIGDAITVHVHEQLPPGESYHLRLEITGGAPLSAASDTADWIFPRAWTLALGAATSARLVVKCGDQGGLSIVHSVQLK